MPDYAQYGLPNDREKPVEDGHKGLKYCPWCQSNVRTGMSLCFQHFCICADCAQEGVDTFEQAPGHFLLTDLSKENQCFKCRKSEGRGYQDRVVDTMLTLCEECVRLAVKVLITCPDTGA